MFYYLATPYTKYAAGLEAAFADASREAALLQAGVPVYCPIAHCHPLAVYGGIDPLDHSIWLPANKCFMDTARGLIVCKLPGWWTSFGINQEVTAFRLAEKPIIYMRPGVVPAEVLG